MSERHSTGAKDGSLDRGLDGKRSGRQEKGNSLNESSLREKRSFSWQSPSTEGKKPRWQACHSETIIGVTESKRLEVQNLSKFGKDSEHTQSLSQFTNSSFQSDVNRGQDGKRAGWQAKKGCHPELVSGSNQLSKSKMLKQVQHEMSFGRKCAFTLAETLITLVIVGIVAAITVPTLMQTNRADTLRSQFMRAYSETDSAVRNLQIKNPYWFDNIDSLVEESKASKDNGNSAAASIGVMLKKEFKNVNEKVKYNSRDESRYFPTHYRNKQNTSGGAIYMGSFGYFETLDGMTIYPECNGDCEYIHIIIDINGYNKKPNRQGYDLFDFQVNKKTGSLVPATEYGSDCTRTDNKSGFDCTKQALEDVNYFKKLGS